MQEDRQDFIEDEHHDWDDHYYHHDDVAVGFVVGATVGVATGVAVASTTSVTTITALPCAGTAMIVNGVAYYQCGTTWYNRGYQGDTVVYIISSPPPGY
jgi:uncharacterized membrane protein